MSRLLLASVLSLGIILPTLAAEPPALTFQTKPVAAMLDDVRAGAKLIGGEDLVKLFEDARKDLFGDFKTQGMDLTKSIAGYVFLTGKETPESKPPVVVVLPISDADAFLKSQGTDETPLEPVKEVKGLYQQKNKDSGEVTYVRIVGKTAYLGLYAEPKHLAPDALVSPDKLISPKETSWLTVKFNFTRMPEQMRKDFAEALEKALKEAQNAPLPAEAEEGLKKVTELSKKLFERWTTQLKEANEAVFRVDFDKKSGELGLEAALSGLPGSSLAKDIASRKPSTNRFASFVGPETVFSLVASSGLNQDISTMFSTSLEETFKEKKDELPGPFQPLVEELFKGLARSSKKGEQDFALVLNGPNDGGNYTAMIGLSFDDTSKLEKEVKQLVKENAPPEFADLIKFDVAKVGAATLHQINLPAEQLPPQVTEIFGDKASLGLGLTPNAIILCFGNDPIGSLKTLVKAEPKPARTFDLKLNPGRVAKLMNKLGADGLVDFKDLLGDQSELYSAVAVDLEGGSELKLKMSFNIRLFGGAVLKLMGR